MTISRRKMLQGMLACGGAAIAGRMAYATTSANATMLERPIPRSGEMLPVIGLGTYVAFDVPSSSPLLPALGQVLQRFTDLGGSVVDSSPMYGNAEAVIGHLVADHHLRPALFLATKVWTRGRDAGIHQMEQSLARLRTDRIDLMQVHNLVDLKTQTATIEAWQKQGRIRYSGITHYDASAYPELEKLVATRRYDFVQFNYSLAERDAEQRLLPLAQETGTAVIINRPFAQGELFAKTKGRPLPSWAAEFDCTSWAQFFLKYIVSNPAVTCAIPATRNPKHLNDNMAAGSDKLPDAAMRKRMVKYWESL
jgi:aryl-alcohol dehydrogenase-like predicted oxidoreductase